MTNKNINAYAIALFEYAHENKCLDAFYKDLTFLKAFMSDNYLHLLSSGFLDKADRCQLFTSVIKKLIDLRLRHFIHLLIHANVIYHFKLMLIVFNQHYYNFKKIYYGKVYSAIALSAKQLTNLTEFYNKKMSGNVILKNVIDTSLIGGIKIKIHDLVFNFTVKEMLADLKNYMLKLTTIINS